MRNIKLRIMKYMGMLSLGVALLSSESTSVFIIHQPKKPKKLIK